VKETQILSVQIYDALGTKVFDIKNMRTNYEIHFSRTLS